MPYSSTTTTTVDVSCDNCGDAIYKGDANAYDDTKTFQGYMPTAFGGAPIESLLLCTGVTCTHNCADALRQALNALPGRVAPPIAPLQPMPK